MNNNRRALLLMLIDDIQSANEYYSLRRRNERREEMLEMYRRRQAEGAFKILIEQHLTDNDTKFRQYVRLSPHLFYFVLSHVKVDLQRIATNCVSNPISAEQKLFLGLRYLASGESFRSLSFQFRISFSYCSVIVREVVTAIRKHLLSIAVPLPTEATFLENAAHNLRRWQFPNCIGAIDGKHIRIKCPNNSGSLCYNYKSFFSVVLLAIVDGRLRFNAIDVGAYGREGDAGIFLRSNIGKAIAAGQFGIPGPAIVAQPEVVLPHVILGDSAFRLTENMMVPFSSRLSNQDPRKFIYNYR